MDGIIGAAESKVKQHSAEHREALARRRRLRQGIRIACLLAVLIVPVFITIYSGAVLEAANKHEQPLSEGGLAAYAPVPSVTPQPVQLSPVSPEPSAGTQGNAPDGMTVGVPDGTSEVNPDVSTGAAAGGLPGGSTGGITDGSTGVSTGVSTGGSTGVSTDVSTTGSTDGTTGNAAEGKPYATDEPAYPVPDKVAYITIDDGPTRSITPGMLDVLMEKGVTATFFILPQKNVDDLYMRIIDEGHELGNHTYSHVYKRLYQAGGLEVFKEEVLDAQEFIFSNFGYTMTSFRFPGGSMGRSASIIEPRMALLDELGYRYFNWHIDSGDARADIPDRSAAALTRNVLDNTRDREHLIVLMHDSAGKKTTLDALPGIIEGLREQGYAFDILKNYPSE